MTATTETKPVKDTSREPRTLTVMPLPKRVVFNTCRLPSNCH